MSSPARRRLMREFQRLEVGPNAGFAAAPIEENIFIWRAVLFGPEESPYAGGCFQLRIYFSEEYPSKPPKVIFTSNVFHPNIYPNGEVCVDILEDKWKATYNVQTLLDSLRLLLAEPNPHSAANETAAEMMANDRKEFERIVSEDVDATLRQQHQLD